MIEFRLFGSMKLRREDGSSVLSVLAQPKRAALLAYLALARNLSTRMRHSVPIN